MNEATKVILIIGGIVELVLRAAIVLLLVVSFIGILALMMFEESDAGIQGLLQPWCFKYLREQTASGEVRLSTRQRRELEFQRLKTEQQKRHNAVLRETRELEGLIFPDAPGQ